MAAVPLPELTPEEESKALVRIEFQQLQAQSDFFGWRLRLLDAGDFYVIFARIAGRGGRVFVLKLECDDYWQLAPLSGFIEPELFESANESTPFKQIPTPPATMSITAAGHCP